MTNHFRTLLMNLSDNDTPEEFISPGFVSRVLPASFSAIYKELFPSSDREAVLLNTQRYLDLIHGANIPEVITTIDDRVTYVDKDFDNFKSAGTDLAKVLTGLKQQSQAINAILAIPAAVDTTKYDNMWLQHPNDVYKLAGLIASYTLRLK